MNNLDLKIIGQLNSNPELKSRIISILNIASNEDKIILADDVEAKTIEEIRKLGNEIIHTWAKERVDETIKEQFDDKNIKKKGKKTLYWQTTYGKVEIEEPIFTKENKQYRPFSSTAEVKCRGYSMPLERVLTDFGADDSFGKAQKKVKEHYNIDIPKSAVIRVTEKHAQNMSENNNKIDLEAKHDNCEKDLIAEIDGSMIPIVNINENSKDKRKNKKLSWKEARLAIAFQVKNKNPKFGVEFQEGVDKAGQELKNCTIRAGYGDATNLHCIGDGAEWIHNQVKKQFGEKTPYLVDFYHVCEYLNDASKICSPKDNKKWLEKQKEYLKNNEYKKVLEELNKYEEPSEIPDNKAFVRKCYRYLDNRKDQLDYKNAINNDLPIDSGEIESANRYIVQDRLKLSGAWWKISSAKNMLNLRINRANELWDDYWKNLKKVA
jgi:hypothetical protein